MDISFSLELEQCLLGLLILFKMSQLPTLIGLLIQASPLDFEECRSLETVLVSEMQLCIWTYNIEDYDKK